MPNVEVEVDEEGPKHPKQETEEGEVGGQSRFDSEVTFTWFRVWD